MMTKLLQVSGLAKSFGAVHAVKKVDFTIEEGHCVALLGPNGAGKTTTIRMITGLLKPSAGQMKFHGVGADDNQRSMLGYLPQSPTFYNWMSGQEYVVYAGRLCGLSAETAQKRAKELLERVGLAEAAKRRIRGYSGGMRQRLGLAQALVHQPRLLIMDEPVSALDPLGRREVLTLLRELKQETTVLFSTHVLHDAEELCDDVIIIRDGQVALHGSLSDIRNEHQKPVIELRMEEDAHSERWLAAFIEKVEAMSLEPSQSRIIERVEVQHGIVRFTADNVNTARQMLLDELAQERVKVKRLEVGYTSLEDLFMKAVSL